MKLRASTCGSLGLALALAGPALAQGDIFNPGALDDEQEQAGPEQEQAGPVREQGGPEQEQDPVGAIDGLSDDEQAELQERLAGDDEQQAAREQEKIPGLDLEQDIIDDQPLDEDLAEDAIGPAPEPPSDPETVEHVQQTTADIEREARRLKEDLEQPDDAYTPDQWQAMIDEAEARRREQQQALLDEHEAALGGAAGEVERVAQGAIGERPADEEATVGYGAPLIPPEDGESWSYRSGPLGLVRDGAPLAREEEDEAPRGAGQHSFWEKLLSTVLTGVGAGVKAGLRRRLAVERMNELKARADRLALGMTHDRPYADHEVRRALYNSGIASSGYDRRLRDLLIPGNNDGGSLRPTSGSAGAGGPTAVDVNVSSGQPVRKVPRLDTAMNPLTNQPMTWTPPAGGGPIPLKKVDLPLGAPAGRPLGPR